MTSWKDSDFILSRALKLNRKPQERIAEGALPPPLELFHIYILAGAHKRALVPEKSEKCLFKSWRKEKKIDFENWIPCLPVNFKLVDKIVCC